jgi:ABC-type Mn2+/Zn2+ transport system ATPase subunit
VDAVRIEGLRVVYGSRPALDGVDLTVETGTSVAVIGPNGSGKSTLLGVIAGLVAPSAGRVDRLSDDIALVLQSTVVDRSVPITVLETVRMARYPHRGILRRFRSEDHEAVERAMVRTGVVDLASRQLHELSGGQRQRALLAQGLAQAAGTLLLDEPTTGLDVVSHEVVIGVIDEERAAGHAVVLTTHSLEDAARCDHVLLLANNVVAQGPPSEVLVDHHLRSAFGGEAFRLPSGELIIEEPHHHPVA